MKCLKTSVVNSPFITIILKVLSKDQYQHHFENLLEIKIFRFHSRTKSDILSY
jgi:hypothetical protein